MITDLAGNVGSKILGLLIYLSRIAKLSRETLYWIFIAPFRGSAIRFEHVVRQMNMAGLASTPIVVTIVTFVGMILAMQTAYQLRRFGALPLVADLVAVSITRELGPLITAIIIAGRIGSAYAAEIGTMKVSEELAALRTMALNPVSFLVVPRLIAMIIMLPCLTIISDLSGIVGGWFVGHMALGLGTSQYMRHTIDSLVMMDINTGLIKSIAFGILITAIGCYEGFSVAGGAEGVGRATTRAVVISIFMIIVADCFFTALFYFSL